ncbi:hypothetical protein EYZ11_006053 [Aspergillus tanneri]|uniref:N-acetyltransferase domain-containing protein n=1 Tax=Aspergillus tanneri TaxID=1220188 RepID=A0A4S3JIY3_9EURO|nr:uncharacterized protein ATNIH1004_004776 [Aspergillus tanneri]KAA8648889.1 hypothetical protein ATNIH1004_004776 [Aspergillus tanneri]THC94488.1 hypothetical protein EYZ11_006053 [Aspergillus tanneri]
MPIQTRPTIESDVPALALINIDCFSHHEYWHNAFPSMDPARTYPLKFARCLQKLDSMDEHVFTAVDSTTGRIIGWSRWTIPGSADARVPLSEEAKMKITQIESVIPEGTNRALYDDFFTTLKETRALNMEIDDIALDYIATSSEYQRKGVATKLLQWGMDYADENDVRIYLEATPEGYPLYRKYGWRKVEDIVLDFEPFGGKGTATYIVMTRERKSKRS